jgi:hypothetical protein
LDETCNIYLYLVARDAVNTAEKNRDTFSGPNDPQIIAAQQQVAALPDSSTIKASLEQSLNDLIG